MPLVPNENSEWRTGGSSMRTVTRWAIWRLEQPLRNKFSERAGERAQMQAEWSTRNCEYVPGISGCLSLVAVNRLLVGLARTPAAQPQLDPARCAPCGLFARQWRAPLLTVEPGIRAALWYSGAKCSALSLVPKPRRMSVLQVERFA